MDKLPEEVLIEIFDYLEPEELISIQLTCSTLSKVGRANPLWRHKCFEKSPSASMSNVMIRFYNALLDRPPPAHPRQSWGLPPDGHVSKRRGESARARAVNQWDFSGEGERVDWYSEYKSRYAPMSVDWLVNETTSPFEIRGVSSRGMNDNTVGYLEDGSVCIWDLSRSPSGRRTFRELGRSKPSILFADANQPGETLVVDCVSTFPLQQKAFVAVGNVLNEVDLHTLTVVSHAKYPFQITALSQSAYPNLPLTVGTQWSLHIVDPRIPVIPTSQSSHEQTDEVSCTPGSSTAILPDMSGDSSMLPSIFGTSPSLSSNAGPSTHSSGSPSWRPSHRLQNPQWMGYARVEPGPLSILHHAENEILICGRFPSILSYDRRYFPRLQYVIHSSASLSAMTSIPYPPARASANVVGDATLIACGEYRGRGSLELYSLPHTKPGQRQSNPDISTSSSPSEDDDLDITRNRNLTSDDGLFSYKNRQDAAKSKLLSVASHGTKIVFSDSEGGLKWVERDGHSVVRRWNLNNFLTDHPNAISTYASTYGDAVARKIIPLDAPSSEWGSRGDADLLIWTGEKIGIVTTDPNFMDHEEMVREIEGDVEGKREKEERKRKEEEYSKVMRRALERQADERRWMSQFRLKRRDYI
ncbi:uncharacterized protein A1O5_13339 [Cladophialophora psammophila CBS 110553]|uniref:F-box domain-containing protein n=1 Tax=Cladophialophora psammophila CBS 110553 TaxID=1182543 RepID=W9VK60_9EURO|nr:uncharacterized protein A1O5_13339 [Cladophialophora psammophila CBS 110553]EXJ53405.1 hypothetical protein A1O5_13339 [Cladophialophora psammophila CBS 110553]